MGFFKKLLGRQKGLTDSPESSFELEKRTFEFDKTLKNNNQLKTIVFLTRDLPYYDKDSGSNRLKEIMCGFVRKKYQVILVPTNAKPNNSYYRRLELLSILVYFKCPKYPNALAFLKKNSIKIDYFWFNGPNTYKAYYKAIKQNFPFEKIVYDMVDVHHLRIKREMAFLPKKLSNKKRYKKYFRIESKSINQSDLIITISEKEKQYMSKFIEENKMITISNVHFPKINFDQLPELKLRKDLLFVGSTHPPNIDAIDYLANQIMPLVWKKLPQVKVHVVGNLKEKIDGRSFDSRVVFHGYVRDISPFYLHSRMMVAPLRYGAGVKGKLGQALEYFLPIITSTIGAEGMFFTHQKNALIANNTQEFAQEIIRLYSDDQLWKLLSGYSVESLSPFSIEKLEQTISATF